MIKKIHKAVGYVFGKSNGAEGIRYVIVGALTTVANFAIFSLMTLILGIEVTLSNVISIFISILLAYVSNKLIVFRRQSGSFAELAFEFMKFVGSRLFTMAMEVGIVHVFYYTLGHDALLGKVIATVFVVVSNYIISKAIVFRKPKKTDYDKSRG